MKEVVGDSAPNADITQSTNEQFGHYQCNSAMKVAKELKASPREIAEKIIEKWRPDGVIGKLEVAGPGFINITLTKEFLSKQLTQVAADSRLGVPPLERIKKIIEAAAKGEKLW